MLDVHARLRGAAGEADPLVRVADGLVGRAKVLALDEFFVTDVADAMILHRWVGGALGLWGVGGGGREGGGRGGGGERVWAPEGGKEGAP